MAGLIAAVDGCQGCGACLLTCPEHAIRPASPERAIRPVRPAWDAGRRLAVLAQRCTGCGECVEVCPVDAIDLVPG